MSDKKFYYLSGMFRSGNTLLSAILNQNPNFYSSPLSPISGYMWSLSNNFNTTQNDLRSKDKSGQESIMKNMLKNYYSNIDKPIIFDREKQWPSPENFKILKKYVDPNPKIIYTVRPMLEVLMSLINVFGSELDFAMEQEGWVTRPYLDINDNKCDYLMQTQSHYSLSMLCFNSIFESPQNFHLVEYNDLINKPEDTMNKIYEFLELPKYQHDFNNIKKIEEDNDVLVNLPEHLHRIRPELKKISGNPDEFFSDYVKEKYGCLDFWKNFKK